MSQPGYQGFWGIKTGQTLEAIADFLSWNKDDWIAFEKVLDQLEKPRNGSAQKQMPRPAFQKKVRDLLKRGAVIKKRVGSRVLISLSDDGWRYARARRIQRVSAACRNGFVIVTFDIPEKFRRERNLLRQFLKQSGFEQLHRSVWVHRRDVAVLVAEVIAELRLRPWVTVAEGKLIVSDFS